ncbi:phosphatidate phosphatase APP1 [Pedobacter cryoconitis]|uniref:Phosphatidate phosphatase APP1 n=1 Tax=Pedobacter cryoconitis TaxID=188932 RepID=A0A7W8ZML2_9SPHI|nr:phosphatase domain-containing protein [Pedobacter cryoconitis]MBB5636792.1 phosphatidate phosphatase APP1 [Pedobacter cryoconitis]
MNNSVSVKVYHGYGHTNNLVIYGHVFKFRAKNTQNYSNNFFVNIVYLIRMFILKPYPWLKVRLSFYDQIVYQTTEYDGFFKFEWKAEQNVSAGWHQVKVEALTDNGEVLAVNTGDVYVPHITQYAFISDIDDTIMVSHSATIGRRLRELFIKNPHTRKTFPGVTSYYNLLALSRTDAEHPNPFFYVSSSEWNLYDYLVSTFRFNQLPEGAFLLNQIKRWKDLLKTGKTGHEGKLMRVMRIIDAFPNQKFILFGDNSQQDPEIYTTIAMKHPECIEAIYIRNIRRERQKATLDTLSKAAEKSIHTCLFTDSKEAMSDAVKIGLINI